MAAQLLAPMLLQALMGSLLYVLVHAGSDGKQLRKQSLSWNEPPSAVVYTEPYIIAQLPNNLQVVFCKPMSTTGSHTTLVSYDQLFRQ